MKLTSLLQFFLLHCSSRVDAYSLLGATNGTTPAPNFGNVSANECGVNEKQCTPDESSYFDRDKATVPNLKQQAIDYS